MCQGFGSENLILDIETSLGQTIQFMVSAERVGREVERWPMGNLFEYHSSDQKWPVMDGLSLRTEFAH